MSYTLIGSSRSPFARACRLFLESHRLPYEFRVLDFVQKEQDAKALSKESPINKVPVLIDGQSKIYDSRVIINYLIKKHGLPALSVEDENRVSSIYATMDSGVILFLMRQDKFDVSAPGFFLSRQRARIPDNLQFVTPWAASLNPNNDWDYPAMALFCAFYWLQARELINAQDYPLLEQFMDKFKNQPGIAESAF